MSVVSISAKSQTVSETDRQFPIPFQFSEVDTFNGTDDQLYTKAFAFIVSSFNSAKDVVQMQDRAAGVIIVKGILTTNTMTDGWGRITGGEDNVNFTMTINIKNGRVRIALTDFVHNNGYGNYFKEFGSLDAIPGREIHKRQKSRYYMVKNEVDMRSKGLITAFMSHMNKNDEW